MCSKYTRWLGSLFVVFIFSGCFLLGPSKPKIKSVKREKVFVYRVARNTETFGGIVEKLTGSRQNWRKILAFNPKLNIEKIVVGTKINIPHKFIRAGLRSTADSLAFVKKQPSKSIKSVTSKKAEVKKVDKQVKSISHPRIINPPKDQIEIVPLTNQLETFEEIDNFQEVIRDPATKNHEMIVPDSIIPVIENEKSIEAPLNEVSQVEQSMENLNPDNSEDLIHKKYEDLMQQIEME